MSAYKKYLIILVLVSLSIRCFLAGYLELNNDEAYYWAYALFPDWSHFDNPSMVGWLIQLFTHNLQYDSPFFIRSMSLVISTLNTILIFIIGCKIKNEKTGWYGALLYNLSIYGLISLGVNVTPEVPQSFLWLLTTLMLIYLFSDKDIKHVDRFQIALVGILIGLSILCKYNSIFLWIGILIYIILFQRSWLKKYSLYMSIFITLLFTIPILWWNVENRSIGFSKIENLPSFSDTTNVWIFIKKWCWQIIYYNPVNLLLVLLGFLHLTIKKNISKSTVRLFLCLCIPIWGTFSILSFFKNISLQWILIAGLPLLLVAAAYLADIKNKISKIMLWISASFMICFLCISIVYREFNLLPRNILQEKENPLLIFKYYGWQQLSEKFSIIREQHLQQKMMDSTSNILATKWHQASTLDYYVARPNNIGVKTIGFIKATFEYAQISNKRGGFKIGDDFYFITSTQDFEDPYTLYANYFKKIVLSDTISVLIHKNILNKYLIYQLYDLKEIPNL